MQYTMLYFNPSVVDCERLFRACSDLVQTHDILRSVFIEHDSTFLQVVLHALDAPMSIERADGDLEQCVTALCATNIDSDFPLGSSFLKLQYIKGTDAKGCLVIGLSHAQYDGMSLPRLLRDLETLYTGRLVVEFSPFSSYISHIRSSRALSPALKYWSGLLHGSSLSILAPSPQHSTTDNDKDKSLFLSRPVSTPSLEDFTTASLLTAS
jgi:fusarinine C synthase